MLIKPKYIIIHHSLTNDNQTVSWTAIRRWHTGDHPDSNLRWNDIGYHFGVELIGPYYEVLAGRPIGQIGAHCPQRNRDSIGVCFVGNYDISEVPDEMLIRAVDVLSPIVEIFEIPKENIQPHSYYSSKSCPGNNFPLERFKSLLYKENWGA